MKKVGINRGGVVGTLATVLLLLVLLLLFLTPLTLAADDDDEKLDPEKITPEDFSKLTPAKQDEMFPKIPAAKQAEILQKHYRDELAEKFFQNKAQIANPANAEIAKKYFDNPSNVVKDLDTAKEYFKQPGKIQEAGAGAHKYFVTKYKANYQFDPSATNLDYDPDKGTLSIPSTSPTEEPKSINLADYKGDSSIQEIRAEGNEFVIKRRVGDKDESMRITGDSGADISFKDGKFMLKDKAGNTHDIESEGDAVLDIGSQGVTIEGQASGTAVIAGKVVDFKNRKGKLFMAPNGDMSADDAWVDSATLQIDGKFSKQGNDIHSHAYEGRETTLVDKQSGIGVITRGVPALTHLDTVGPHTEGMVPPSLTAQQAKEVASGLREAPAGPAPEQAEVWIKNDGSSTAVYAKGKVDVAHHVIDESDVLGIDTAKPRYSGKDLDAKFEYTTDNAPDNPAEKFIMSGIGTYTDMQMVMDGEQKGASVKKLNPSATHDMLDVSCKGCKDGTGVRVRKNLVLFNNKKELSDEQIQSAKTAGLNVEAAEQATKSRTPHRATLEIRYDMKDGKFVVDSNKAQLQTIATLLGTGMEVAADKQLLTKVEGENTFFGLGQNGVGRYESHKDEETNVVSLVLHNPEGSKSPLGQKIRFDMGIDPTKLNDPKYVGEMDKALDAKVKADKHLQQLQKRFAKMKGKRFKGAEMGADGICMNQECQRALKAMPQFQRIQLRLQKEHLKAENAKNRALVSALQADGKSTKLVEAKIKENKKKYRAAKKVQQTLYEQDQKKLAVTKRDDKQAGQAKEAILVAEKFGKQNRRLGKNIRVLEGDIEGLRERLKGEDRPEYRKGLQDRIASLKKKINTFKQEHQEVTNLYENALAANEGDPHVLAEMALNTGNTADLNTAMKLAEKIKGDQGHLLVAKACAQVGDAQCVAQRVAAIKNPRVKEKAAAAQEQIEDQAMAKMVQQARELRQRESKARTEFEEERRTNILAKVSFLANWYEHDEQHEKQAKDYVEGISDAAYATAMLRKKLKADGKDTSFAAIRAMPDEQKRAILGDKIPLGNFGSFDRTMLKTEEKLAMGKSLSVQERFDLAKEAADQKVMFAHGDVVAAEKEYKALLADMGHLTDKVRGIRNLRKTVDQVRRDKELVFAGVETGIHTPWSYQTVGRIASESMDITIAADLLVGGAIAGKALKTALETSETALKVAKKARTLKTAAAQTRPAVAVMKAGSVAKAKGVEIAAGAADVGRRLAKPAVALAKTKPAQAVAEAGKNLVKFENSAIANVVTPNAKKLGRSAAKGAATVKEVLTKPRYLRPSESQKAVKAAEAEAKLTRKLVAGMNKEEKAEFAATIVRAEEKVVAARKEADLLDKADKLAKKAIKQQKKAAKKPPKPAEVIKSQAEKNMERGVIIDTADDIAVRMGTKKIFGRQKSKNVAKRLEKLKKAYADAKEAGTHAERLAAARKLKKLNDHKEKMRDLEAVADTYFRRVARQHAKKMAETAEAAGDISKVAKATARTMPPTTAKAAAHEADDLTEVALFGTGARNVDYEAMPQLCKATGTCDPTPFGAEVAQRAGMTPDEFAEQANALRAMDQASEVSDLASGSRVMQEAQRAQRGKGPSAVVTPTGSMGAITPRPRVNPTSKLDAPTKAKLSARLDKSHTSLAGVHAHESAAPFPKPPKQLRRQQQAVRQQEARLEKARKEGVFDEVADTVDDVDVPFDPSKRTELPEVPDLTDEARLIPPPIADDTLDATIPIPVPTEKPKGGFTRQEKVVLEPGATQPTPLRENIIPGLEDVVARAPEAGYTGRAEILSDVKPLTDFLEGQDVKWAVSGSGGIADELAIMGQRTGDADLLIPTSKWESLDEMLQARARDGTLGEIGIKEYRPMKHDPFDVPGGVGFDSRAKGEVVLANGQEVDLIAGFGYKVTDPKAIKKGMVEVAPGVTLPLEKTPDGRHRVELFDIDNAGNPNVPSFFQKGEGGATFMTPDALRAKYTFEKRTDRLRMLDEMEEKGIADLAGLPKTKITKRPSKVQDKVHPVDPKLHYTDPALAKHAEAGPAVARELDELTQGHKARSAQSDKLKQEFPEVQPRKAQVNIETKLGEGDNGVVFTGSVDGKEMVLKAAKVDGKTVRPEDAMRELFQEASNIQKGACEGMPCPKIHGVYEQDGVVYMAMEKVEGKHMRDLNTDEVMEYFTPDKVTQFQSQLEKKIQQGWDPVDLQGMVATKAQRLDDVDYAPGDFVLMDTAQWNKGPPVSPEVAKKRANRYIDHIMTRERDAARKVQDLRHRHRKVAKTLDNALGNDMDGVRQAIARMHGDAVADKFVARLSESKDPMKYMYYQGLDPEDVAKNYNKVKSAEVADGTLDAIPAVARVDETMDAIPAVRPGVADETLDSIPAVDPRVAADETFDAIPTVRVDDTVDAIPTPKVDETLDAIPVAKVDGTLDAIPVAKVDETLDAVPDLGATQPIRVPQPDVEDLTKTQPIRALPAQAKPIGPSVSKRTQYFQDQMDEAFSKAGREIDHPLVGSSEMRVTAKEIDGAQQFEISGHLKDKKGANLGGFDDGSFFKQTIRVDEDGVATVQRQFKFDRTHDERLITKTIEAENEHVRKALLQMGVDDYRTIPNSPVEFKALCGTRPCRIADSRGDVAEDVESWLQSTPGRNFLDSTEGKQWYGTVQEEKGFFAGLVDKIRGKSPVDADKLPASVNMYPDEFMKGKAYPVDVDVFSDGMADNVVSLEISKANRALVGNAIRNQYVTEGVRKLTQRIRCVAG